MTLWVISRQGVSQNRNGGVSFSLLDYMQWSRFAKPTCCRALSLFDRSRHVLKGQRCLFQAIDYKSRSLRRYYQCRFRQKATCVFPYEDVSVQDWHRAWEAWILQEQQTAAQLRSYWTSTWRVVQAAWMGTHHGRQVHHWGRKRRTERYYRAGWSIWIERGAGQHPSWNLWRSWESSQSGMSM